MDVEKILKIIESKKTTKSVKTYLNKIGINTEEGFRNSYDFYIDGIHYRALKHNGDKNVRVIKYLKKTYVEDINTSIRLMNIPMCYGKTIKL